VNCGRLQHGSPGDQEGFDGFAEVLHEMKAIDDLHRLRCTLTNAVRIEGTPIPTDHGDRGMLGKPGRDGGSRAVQQEVDDAMGRQIDEDGAIPMASPPRPLVHAHRLEGLCTISRFWSLLLDLHRYKLINSMLNFELLCKAAWRGEGNGTGAAYTSRRRVDGLVDSCRRAACRAPACRPRARPIAWSAATSRWV
jgi:hypothetical protein